MRRRGGEEARRGGGEKEKRRGGQEVREVRRDRRQEGQKVRRTGGLLFSGLLKGQETQMSKRDVRSKPEIIGNDSQTVNISGEECIGQCSVCMCRCFVC